jgi:hypothetical protein
VTPPEGGFAIITNTLSMNRVIYIPPLRDTASNGSLTSAQSIYLPIVTSPLKLTLLLWATDDVSGVGEMMISNNPGFIGAQWEPYTTRRDWWISSIVTTTICVKFLDNAGNVSVVYTNTYNP